jgi:hypothetical protein
MFRLFFSVLFFLLFGSILFGQNINIKKINVSRVITKIEKGAWEEKQEEGPSVYFELEIENNTNSVLTLDSSESEFDILFKFKGKSYIDTSIVSMALIPFYDKKEICIKPNEKYPVKFSCRILLGTNLLKFDSVNKYYDYTEEMLQILPTLQIQYVDPKLKIISGRIEEVGTEHYIYIIKAPK